MRRAATLAPSARGGRARWPATARCESMRERARRPPRALRVPKTPWPRDATVARDRGARSSALFDNRHVMRGVNPQRRLFERTLNWAERPCDESRHEVRQEREVLHLDNP